MLPLKILHSYLPELLFQHRLQVHAYVQLSRVLTKAGALGKRFPKYCGFTQGCKYCL